MHANYAHVNTNALAEKTRLVTGATGFIGSHFVNRLLSYEPRQTYALVRADTPAHGYERVLRAVEGAAKAYHADSCVRSGAPILPVLGDVAEPNCGIAAEQLVSLTKAGIDELWHFAASLNYEESRREKIEAMNIRGSENILALAKDLGVKHLIHVSTAYTSGKLEGRIHEEPHWPLSDFNNVYESTKNIAESKAIDFCKKHDIKLTILRPSIVIGLAKNKLDGGSRTGLYGFVKELVGLKNAMEKKGMNEVVRIRGDVKVRLNFIPIDQMMDDVFALMHMQYGEREIYHLTGDCQVALPQFFSLAARAVGLPGLSVLEDFNDELTRLEQNFESRIEFYSGYFRYPKEFHRTLSSKWTITGDDLYQFVQQAVKNAMEPTL